MESKNMDANCQCHADAVARRSVREPKVLPWRRQSRRRSLAIRRQASSERGQLGLTLVELIVTVAILGILASVAYPIARFQIQRQKEQVLRDDLWTMRHAIDEYKDAADRHAFQVSIDSNGYPPDLDTLVNGVDVQGHKVRFLRQIPVDPMTGKKDWVLRSMQDDPDSDSWGGQNVFDVHSASQDTALDGTKYNTW
jgi:general secretion pathway protein G